jgi:hypothetical protein
MSVKSEASATDPANISSADRFSRISAGKMVLKTALDES